MSSELEDILTCCICLDKIVQPKSLPCQHSFCNEPCLSNMILRNKTITCPICRQQCQTPPQGFPTNFLIQKLLDIKLDDGNVPKPSAPTEELLNNPAGKNIDYYDDEELLDEFLMLSLEANDNENGVVERNHEINSLEKELEEAIRRSLDPQYNNSLERESPPIQEDPNVFSSEGIFVVINNNNNNTSGSTSTSSSRCVDPNSIEGQKIIKSAEMAGAQARKQAAQAREQAAHAREQAEEQAAQAREQAAHAREQAKEQAAQAREQAAHAWEQARKEAEKARETAQARKAALQNRAVGKMAAHFNKLDQNNREEAYHQYGKW